jgi:hypothetical protein
MKSWVFGVITLACTTIGGAALACPTGGEQGTRPVRPVIQNVSLQASEMIERAGRLETVASSHDAEARALEQQADTLTNRARVLRNQAGFVNVSDRSSILAIADELSVRAANERSRAAEERVQAQTFRIEAQNLRQRALVLVRGGGGGGGGWRRSTIAPQSTPFPTERTTVL